MSTDGTTLGFLHDEGKTCLVFRFRLPMLFSLVSGVVMVLLYIGFVILPFRGMGVGFEEPHLRPMF